ncbi:ABC transporter ATP-binding protein [Beijerinckia indica]|uniref:Oligopeptide/dipeptide ABC transporter, ATPase subunit n=1 Tax=Beijerinckia indica subsp. indica (strain ATCC 9039 / DSM 1715 / NCIMB 8712) TaxID=395963 RepID=B2IIU3_BEII9|nr:oligopeptide/dipeptide ABC transporter ATP-binding protein [Beijerinckia indica]ACB96155.1 oligopeptide/dipeptide ABC transporter, ATPase subunit [Beijerinckia indica subsp. indica ATCC 9039]
MSLLSVTDLRTHYSGKAGLLRAVDGVSLSVGQGETVGLVGESGCGKSTLGKTITRLVSPTKGRILFKDEDITHLGDKALRPVRRRLQMIFQDPFGSLNPRQSIKDILAAPLVVHGYGDRAARAKRVEDFLDRVGLPRHVLSHYPHEFSGGQRQRIGIARALILDPELVVCDEPVSALDRSIQAQILNLLSAMKTELNLSYLFISHDLSVVRYFTDRVLVMYLGRIVESADSKTFWAQPKHPYTHALIDAVPDPDRRRHAAPISGDLPSPRNIPPGCRFHPRCPSVTALCRTDEPALRALSPTHEVACHHANTM